MRPCSAGSTAMTRPVPRALGLRWQSAAIASVCAASRANMNAATSGRDVTEFRMRTETALATTRLQSIAPLPSTIRHAGHGYGRSEERRGQKKAPDERGLSEGGNAHD